MVKDIIGRSAMQMQKYKRKAKVLETGHFRIGICNYEIRNRNMFLYFMYLYISSYIPINPYIIYIFKVLK